MELAMTIPVSTRKQKPTRADVPPGGTFQNVVEGWIFGDALALMNRRHLDGKMSLEAGDPRHVAALANWLDKLADQEFSQDDTTGHPEETRGKFRLDLEKVKASNLRRACRAIEVWDPSKIEGRSRGGRHGAHDGVRKGPAPRYTQADLLPDWDLPPRRRRAAVMARTGMSSGRFDQLKVGMDALVASIQERSEARRALDRELSALVPDSMESRSNLQCHRAVDLTQ